MSFEFNVPRNPAVLNNVVELKTRVFRFKLEHMVLPPKLFYIKFWPQRNELHYLKPSITFRSIYQLFRERLKLNASMNSFILKWFRNLSFLP